MELKRKMPLQLQALEQFYSEDKYPTLRAMREYAASLGLTVKQVRGWFVEKRRRDKRDDGMSELPGPSKQVQIIRGRGKASLGSQCVVAGQDSFLGNRGRKASRVEKGIAKSRNINMPLCIQDMLFSPDYILKKVFRKDGPSLGIEFDSPPSGASFCHQSGSRRNNGEMEIQKEIKRRKVSNDTAIDRQKGYRGGPVKKHGIGKGLMTVWWATNPDGGCFPTGIDFGVATHNSKSKLQKPAGQRKRLQRQTAAMRERKLKKKLEEMKKATLKKREACCTIDKNLKLPQNERCDLALQGPVSEESVDKFGLLMDDEELELKELQCPNSVACLEHLSPGGQHDYSLGKDLLAKFPPDFIKMKHPLSMHPWASSPDLVKKLFKAFHFIYTYAVIIDINSFTLDEFAQAFHEKDSLLLGRIHLALLKLLLVDLERELSGGSLHHLKKSCAFLALLHSVENQQMIVDAWQKCLNPLTWNEVLRQVLIAAGFGSKQGSHQREAISEEMRRMIKYGLQPGTLKGELFKLLSELGNNGLKVSEMARCSQIAELNKSSTTEELEVAICSTLSSDITLFEKISSSTYRLRVSFNDTEDFHSDSEDSGSVDDLHDDGGICCSSDNSECEPGNLSIVKYERVNRHKNKNSKVVAKTEIDESIHGEVWLLGLLEGEYSDLSIDEKLSALAALIDLLSAGSSVKMEDPAKEIAVNVPTIYAGSGAKIKRASANQTTSVYSEQWGRSKDSWSTNELGPVDSSAFMATSCSTKITQWNNANKTEISDGVHPMLSVFLGSDRRYNRYWLFLGPCNAYDPGHRRVYFESSEDGHWEVIDTEDALSALLTILDERGIREACLMEALENRKAFIFQAMSSRISDHSNRLVASYDQAESDIIRGESSPVSDVDNGLSFLTSGDSVPSVSAVVFESGKKGGEEQKLKWSRLKVFDEWIWNSFYMELNAVKLRKRSYIDSLTRCERCHDLYWRDEKHCKICHTTFELNFDLEERYAIHTATCRVKEADSYPKHKVLSAQLQSLKAAIHAIESAMPEGALIGAWTKSAHRLWVNRLRRTSTLPELLQVLADFVNAINVDWFSQSNSLVDNGILSTLAFFPTIPHTSSAVALWVVKLDTLLASYMEEGALQ